MTLTTHFQSVRFYFRKTIQPRTDMETSTPTFDQLPHVVSGLSENLTECLTCLKRQASPATPNKPKPSRRLVYAKEACQIIGKSLSTLYRAVKAPNDPIPSYKRGKLLYFMRMKYTHGSRAAANTPPLHPSPKPQRPSLPV